MHLQEAASRRRQHRDRGHLRGRARCNERAGARPAHPGLFGGGEAPNSEPGWGCSVTHQAAASQTGSLLSKLQRTSISARPPEIPASYSGSRGGCAPFPPKPTLQPESLGSSTSRTHRQRSLEMGDWVDGEDRDYSGQDSGVSLPLHWRGCKALFCSRAQRDPGTPTLPDPGWGPSGEVATTPSWGSGVQGGCARTLGAGAGPRSRVARAPWGCSPKRAQPRSCQPPPPPRVVSCRVASGRFVSLQRSGSARSLSPGSLGRGVHGRRGPRARRGLWLPLAAACGVAAAPPHRALQPPVSVVRGTVLARSRGGRERERPWGPRGTFGFRGIENPRLAECAFHGEGPPWE